MTNWKTISSKISDETDAAIKVICDKENIKPNEFIRKAVEKSVKSILNPDVFPNIGENKFEYDSEADSFKWSINFGTGNPLIISDNLGSFFVENLQKAIIEGVNDRSRIQSKIKKNQTYIPSSIIKIRKQ